MSLSGPLVVRLVVLLAVVSVGTRASADPLPPVASSAAPKQKLAQPTDERMDEWGVWSNAATSSESDPLLSIEADADKTVRAPDDGADPESADYPVGISGADELRLNELDSSAIGSFEVDAPVAPSEGGGR